MKPIRLLSYSKSGNIGDAIQSLAMKDLVARCALDLKLGFSVENIEWVDRDNPADDDLKSEPSILVNGYLDSRWLPVQSVKIFVDGGPKTFFAGIHTASKEIADKVSKIADGPVGARDPFSKALLPEGAILTGCATMCFRPTQGERKGIYLVDVPETFAVTGGVRQTHAIAATMPWESQLAYALKLLRQYGSAASVYTTRLHVLLPCLAFGTPVALVSEGEASRFGIASSLGVSVRTTPQVYPLSLLSAESIALKAMVKDILTTLNPPAP